MLEAARRVGVERFVNISTDKAADPTQRARLLQAYRRAAHGRSLAASDGTYLSVRFGNVLGSRGSVLTAFAGQIASGGPVTVTDPDVTRYFMTVRRPSSWSSRPAPSAATARRSSSTWASRSASTTWRAS